ncbi:hypothetical protein [Saccharothrix sp.]|uniref:hypothetical protein n=1 Tax=Saccharothrix sp. TaxID=1873460 RepID=UPI0028112CE1|nr:hypothetical protein [Saccharothrix sp.]
MTDIKQTLETAFDGEPPLTLDVPKIVKAGKRRVTVRRAATGVAVLATVTAVCVPAMLGSSGGSSGGSTGSVEVAASPPSTTLTTTTAPPASSTANVPPQDTVTTKPGAEVPSMPRPEPPRPVTEERARQLTALLASSGAIPADAQAKPIPRDPLPPWEFQASGNEYRVVTDVTTPAGKGMVLIYLSPGAAPTCDPGCEVVRQPDGREVFVSTSEFNGIRLLLVDVAIPGGRVHVQVSNSSDKTVGNGERPLTAEQAVKLAAIPGLTF